MNRHFILGVIAGTLFGLTLAGGMVLDAQTPDWYQNTPQGRLQQRLDIQELQFEQDMQRLQSPQYRAPWEKKPC